MSVISDLKAQEILDSRGYPTVFAEVVMDSGLTAQAMVPSGASTGSREALELRDGDNARYHGRGVRKAVAHIVGDLRAALLGKAVTNLEVIDEIMLSLDGTENKSKLGANAMLAVSMACTRILSKQNSAPLYRYFEGQRSLCMPVPMMNIINGGVHANNGLDFQEFMILPVGVERFTEAVRCGAEIFHVLRGLLVEQGLSTAVGDEGGFSPAVTSHAEAIEFILMAIEKAGYQPGKEVYLGLDVASSEFYQDGIYHLRAENHRLNSIEMVEYLAQLVKKYPILSIEDGMAEDDKDGWCLLTKRLGKTTQLVGDDVFVTNTRYLKQGIVAGMANSILIKINQIGTISETMAAIQMAREHHYGIIISHRSGETEDTFIADLAVGSGAGQIKTGSLSRSERTAKYNRLMRIEQQLDGNVEYAGRSVFQEFIS